LGTLKLYLKDILDILNMVNGNSSKSKLKKRIRSMFVDPEMKKISPELNKIIDEKVEEILKYIKN
jgi:hypothetical protein